jgi:hypothetical protein
MTTDVATGLLRATARLTASRCPAASCTTPTADGVEHCLGAPGLSTWIVKSKRHVVAVGDLDATETVAPMTSSERCRA